MVTPSGPEAPKAIATNPTARLADVLPLEPQVRRMLVETTYRLRVATTRPSGVLDVMG